MFYFQFFLALGANVAIKLFFALVPNDIKLFSSIINEFSS
jgi:hypothetical protein